MKERKWETNLVCKFREGGGPAYEGIFDSLKPIESEKGKRFGLGDRMKEWTAG